MKHNDWQIIAFNVIDTKEAEWKLTYTYTEFERRKNYLLITFYNRTDMNEFIENELSTVKA